MAIYTSLTYGILPRKPTFMRAYEKEMGAKRYAFTNDAYQGTCTLSSHELWEQICLHHDKFDITGTQ
jgi:hypothetical protein